MKIKLQKVHYIPTELEPNILYVSEEFYTAVHLCASGCGLKVVTPLDNTEWKLKIRNNLPSLYPSVGNWQFPCKSHYWIRDGEIIWAETWSQEQILAGRQYEERKRQEYYKSLKNKNYGALQKLWSSLKAWLQIK